jgi:primosomal protein N''
MTELWVALVTGGLSLCGVVISNLMANRTTTAKIETSQAVTREKIGELAREVREHNNFARRVPLLEAQVETLRGDIRELQTLHERT